MTTQRRGDACLTGPAPEMRDAMPVRLSALDGIRLIAALGVVIYHYNGHFDVGLELLTPLIVKLYLLVDLFFVLSGFVIAQNYMGRVATPAGYTAYMVRRFARIYPLHILALLAVLVIGQTFILSGYWPSLPPHMRSDRFWAQLALLQAWGLEPTIYYNYPSWSISAEAMQYALLPLYLFVASRLSPWMAVALFVCSTLTIAHSHLAWGPWNEFTADGALRAVPSFFAGVAISVGLRRRAVLPRVPWAATYAYGIGLVVCVRFGLPDAAVILFTPGLVLLAVLSESHTPRTWLCSGPMVALGRASYAIYMLHIPVSMATLALLRPLLGTGTGASVVTCSAAVAATLCLSSISFRWFESPAQRLVICAYDGLRRSQTSPGFPS